MRISDYQQPRRNEIKMKNDDETSTTLGLTKLVNLYHNSLVVVAKRVNTLASKQRCCTFHHNLLENFRAAFSLFWSRGRLRISGSHVEGPHPRGTSLEGVPRECKMLWEHLPRVIYHQVY